MDLVVPDLPLSPKENPQGYRHPSEQGVNAENVEIATSDHLKLRGWLATHPNTERILVYFHENAGSMSNLMQTSALGSPTSRNFIKEPIQMFY